MHFNASAPETAMNAIHAAVDPAMSSTCHARPTHKYIVSMSNCCSTQPERLDKSWLELVSIKVIRFLRHQHIGDGPRRLRLSLNTAVFSFYENNQST